EFAMIYAVELTIAAEHHPMCPAGVAAEEERAARQPAVVRRVKQDRDLLRRAVNSHAAAGGGDVQPFDGDERGLIETDDAGGDAGSAAVGRADRDRIRGGSIA